MTKKLQLQVFLSRVIKDPPYPWYLGFADHERWIHSESCALQVFSLYVWIEVTAKVLFENENKKAFCKIVQIMQNTKIRSGT